MPEPEQRRPALSLSQAAERCGAHRSTVRRKLDAGAFPSAWRDDGRNGPGTGPWMIPVADLLAAGFSLTAPEHEQEHEPVREQERATGPDRGDQERLQGELDSWRRRAEVAEAIAAERASHIADLQVAIRQLGTGLVGVPTSTNQDQDVHPLGGVRANTTEDDGSTAVERPRRRWWQLGR